MKNIKLQIFKDNNLIFEYISDLIPNVGDCVELSDNKGTYIVTDRTFITNKNNVKIFVESLML